jgi:hypothetical protein
MDQWRFRQARKAMDLAKRILEAERARSRSDGSVWLAVRDATTMGDLRRLHRDVMSDASA